MRSHKIILSISVITALVISGCYTQLMTPQEFVQSQGMRSTTHADASYQLNYNQNCLSCHSRVELDDRYLEMKYYGVMTVHNGIMVDPISWNNPYAAPVYEPDPYGWYNPVSPSPWWMPPATSVTTSTPVSTSAEDRNRVRKNGSTRDNTGTRERTPSNPAPVQATPQPSAGNTATTTPSNPPPATTVTTQPAAQPAASTNSSERRRSESDTNNDNNRTRNSGSSRDTSSGGRTR